MTVYVDELTKYPNAWGPFEGGSSHLTADTLEELHAFAKRLGLRRAWFQRHSTAPHYDLTADRRRAAVRAGALEVSARDQAIRRFKARVAGGAP